MIGQVNTRKSAEDPPKAMPPNRMDGHNTPRGGKGGCAQDFLGLDLISSLSPVSHHPNLICTPMEMLLRKDGSYSRRGLWDNIRAKAGSGKKPTKQMLKQEAKIKKHAIKKSKKQK